jgi:beta-glucosidase/6-phospho-beta-glucosidase/beta-galactosidase
VSERTPILATLDGYAVEGGFDAPYQPTTCFAPASHLQMCSSPGEGAGLWRDYEKVIDRVGELGLDGVRLSVEWTRIEPRRGHVEVSALERYHQVLAHARANGLRTAIALVDAAWPAWLGAEAWLMPWIDEVVVAHATRVAESLSEVVDDVVGFARASQMIADGYLNASAPPWRRGAGLDATSATNHVRALSASMAAIPAWTEKWLVDYRELPLVASPRAMRALFDAVPRSHQIHLRSLVRGSGPSAAAAGLLRSSAEGWQVAVSEETLALWSN